MAHIIGARREDLLPGNPYFLIDPAKRHLMLDSGGDPVAASGKVDTAGDTAGKRTFQQTTDSKRPTLEAVGESFVLEFTAAPDTSLRDDSTPALVGSGDVLIAALVKVDGTGQAFFGQGTNSSANGTTIMLVNSTDNLLTQSKDNDGTPADLVVNNTMTGGDWHVVVFSAWVDGSANQIIDVRVDLNVSAASAIKSGFGTQTCDRTVIGGGWFSTAENFHMGGQLGLLGAWPGKPTEFTLSQIYSYYKFRQDALEA